MAQLNSTLQSLIKNRFFKYGVPFFVFMIGGSFGLKEFTTLRYQYTSKIVITPEQEKELNKLKKPEKVTLETEYEKIKQLDIDTWENKRGPRPWEENQKQNAH